LGLDKNEETNRVVLLTPFDEKRHVFTVENPLEGTRKSRKDMANMMNTMMGVPHEEAEKLIPDTQEQRALKEWITTLMVPLVVPFEQGYTDLIFQGPGRAHLIAIIDPEADSSDIIAALTEVGPCQKCFLCMRFSFFFFLCSGIPAQSRESSAYCHAGNRAD